jgi:modification target Cys-rich repeat protein
MKNEKIISRRKFLKQVAKKALPILGTLALMSMPVIAQAEENKRSMGCRDGCMNSCGVACNNSCTGTCDGSCTGCDGSCLGTCQGCEGTCKGTCEGDNK